MTVTYSPVGDSRLVSKFARVAVQYAVGDLNGGSLVLWARPWGVSSLSVPLVSSFLSDPATEVVYDATSGGFQGLYVAKSKLVTMGGNPAALIKRDGGWWNHKTSPYGSNSFGATFEVYFAWFNGSVHVSNPVKYYVPG